MSPAIKDRPRLPARLGAALLLIAGLGCGSDEPVLLGLDGREDGAGAERDEVWQLRAPEAAHRSDPRQVAESYERPEGVQVDVSWFGGRRFDEVQAELTAQLGRLGERRTLDAGRGEELVYERGEVRVVRGVIAMMRVRLAEPLTRTDALLATGFTIYADHWRETHREYRLANAFEFERFRLLKVAPGSDRVQVVEAWKSDPADAAR